MLNRYKTAIQTRLRKGQGSGRATWHQRQLSHFLRSESETLPKGINTQPLVIAASAATELCD